MKAPLRFRDDPSAPPDVRELVRSARPSSAITKEVHARTGARLNRLMVVPAAAGLLFWIKGLAVAGLSVAGVLAAARLVPPFWHGGGDGAPPRSVEAHGRSGQGSLSGTAPRAEIAPPPPIQNGDAPPAAPSAVPSQLPPRRRSPLLDRDRTAPARVESPLEPDPGDSLAREAAMLEGARTLLERNPSGALATLDAYAATFPAGRLGMEREILAVDALRRLGRFSEARARGDALLVRARGSIYEQRVRAMLEALPSP
jgi:hypothetical protein